MVSIAKNEVLRFIKKNAKILDANPGDTNKRTCSLAATLAPNAVAIIIKANRIGGTGLFYAYPNNGTTGMNFDSSGHGLVTLTDTAEFVHAVSSGGADWDIFCLGYFVEGPASE